MTTQTEALTLALEALETSARNWPSDSIIEAIAAIKEALAHPELIQQPASIDEMHDIGNGIMYWAQTEQEPVAWMTPDGEGFRIRFSPPVNDVPLGWDALYLTPPQRTTAEGEDTRSSSATPRPWVGLTTDDWDEIKKQVSYNFEMTTGEYAERISHLVEDRLQEKNT